MTKPSETRPLTEMEKKIFGATIVVPFFISAFIIGMTVCAYLFYANKVATVCGEGDAYLRKITTIGIGLLLPFFYYVLNAILRWPVWMVRPGLRIWPIVICISAIYGLTIILFAASYSQGGNLPTNGQGSASHFDYLYFSISVMTTLGYSDFTPCPEVRSTILLQSLLGFISYPIYTGIIIAKVIEISQGSSLLRED